VKSCSIIYGVVTSQHVIEECVGSPDVVSTADMQRENEAGVLNDFRSNSLVVFYKLNAIYCYWGTWSCELYSRNILAEQDSFD